MSVIYIALPIAILLGGAGMVACVLCIRNGQYDDLETPSVRMLIDDRNLNVQQGESATSPPSETRRSKTSRSETAASDHPDSPC